MQIFMDEADDFSVIHCPVGSMIFLSLKAKPSTGYLWEMDVRMQDDPLEATTVEGFVSNDTTIGSGGSMVWIWEAKKIGYATINATHARPFEQGIHAPILRRFRATILVSDVSKR